MRCVRLRRVGVEGALSGAPLRQRTGEEVCVGGEEAVGAQAVDEGGEVVAGEARAADGRVRGVVGELHRVHGVDLEAEQLQRERRRAVADVAGHDVRLHRQHARRRHPRVVRLGGAGGLVLDARAVDVLVLRGARA